MEKEKITKIVEALLYMTDHPLSVSEVIGVLDMKSIKEEHVKDVLEGIEQSLDQSGSALKLVQVAGGYQMATRSEVAPWVRKLYKERLTVRLSPSALETLSIIAYKQPISRSDIEQIRGVEASGVVDTLLERRLIKVVGRKETIGRPLLYGTTSDFLRQFGLSHLSDLPDLETVKPEVAGSEEETTEDQDQEKVLVHAGADEAPQEQTEADEAPEQTQEPKPQ